MANIDISIIVPIYNVEQYLRECLDSLVAQKLETIEVLMINDGTKDNSGKIAEEYAEKWPEKFKYFVKENGGLSDARNYALPYVKGKYVAFVDSDDYVEENMFSELWSAASKSYPDVVECELDKVYSDRKERIYLPDEYKTISDYMLNARVCAWNKIYRVDWLKKIDVVFPKGLLYEDVCFFCKIMPYLTQLPVTVHLPLYHYRQREGSILNSSNKRILEIHEIFADVFAFYNEKGLGREFEEIVECKYVKTVFCSFLMRMLRMKDRTLRNKVIQETWEIVNAKRPNWKNNKYLKRLTLKNIYLKMISRPTLEIMKVIVR